MKKSISRNLADIQIDKETTWYKLLFAGQIAVLFWLGIMFLLYLFLQDYFPSFDMKANWLKTDDIWGSVKIYWYVFAWAILLTIIKEPKTGSVATARASFTWGAITSIFAGITEEIGHRGLYILTAMISIVIFDFIFKWIVIGLVVIFGLIAVFNLFSKKLPLFAIIVGLAAILFISWFGKLNVVDHPVSWFYEHILFPILSWISFRKLDTILFNPAYAFLFIAGAVSSNATFRDGHKYQGTFGYFNSWVIGFILLHAMMYHGLVVAIIIHAGYDLLMDVIIFAKRLSKNAEEGTVEVIMPEDDDPKSNFQRRLEHYAKNGGRTNTSRKSAFQERLEQMKNERLRNM